MGTFRHPIEIGNPAGTDYELVNPMVDTGSSYTFMPPSILERLEITRSRNTTLTLADGNTIRRALGQARVRVLGKEASMVVVFGDEDGVPLLGAFALEALRLLVDPANRRLINLKYGDTLQAPSIQW